MFFSGNMRCLFIFLLVGLLVCLCESHKKSDKDSSESKKESDKDSSESKKESDKDSSESKKESSASKSDSSASFDLEDQEAELEWKIGKVN